MNNFKEPNNLSELNEYLSDIEDEVKTLYEEENDKKEIYYLLKQIDFIKLDYDTDFHKSFINQLIYFIKSDDEKNFFNFKFKKGTNILDFIINYSSKFKAINKIVSKNIEKGKNEEDSNKNKNKRTKNSIIKEHDNITINSKSSGQNSSSSSSFSVNKSNLIDINKSIDKSKENVKTEKNIIDKEENMIFIKKNFNFSEYETKIKGIEKEKEKKIKSINYYEDDSEIKGNGFEYDSINYIFQKIYSIATNKDFCITYNIEPNIDKVNSIFKGNNKLYKLDKIQFDFIILNLKVADLIEFLIDNYSAIHSNSKLGFAFKKNKFFNLEDLYSLKGEKISEERIDIIGESGVNIFNEKEKCFQLLKYSKLIHNINYLIRENKTEDLFNLLDLLYLNSENKKMILFITNGTYSNFINIKNNKFLQLQNKLSVDSLLIYRNKNLLYRTIFLEKLIKKFKKDGKKIFDDYNEKKFEKIIKESLESPYYEKVVKKLSKIEKKIKYIKTNIFNYFINKNIFIELCNQIMHIIKEKYIKSLSKDNIEILKNKLNEYNEFKEFNETNSDTVDKKIYIINTEKNLQEKVETIINRFKENNKNHLMYVVSNNLDILYEKKSNIYKIVILFVNESFFNDLKIYSKIYHLKNDLHINKLNPIIIYINNKEIEISFNKYNSLFELNFNCIYNDNQLRNVINEIIDDKYKNDLYKEYTDLIKEEKYYKYIINRYLQIFNKTIFGLKKEKYEKYEKIFLKISQDIQFLQNFNVDDKNILDDRTKNKIIDIIKNKDIKKLIDKLLEEIKILDEIDTALIEFGEDIEEIKKRRKENKRENNTIFINEANNKINKNISNDISNNINDENKKVIIPDNNNKIIEKNEIEDISDNENEREENSINKLESEIKECEKILNSSDSEQTIETKVKKEKNYKYLILNELIRNNIEEIIKNEILLVVYVVLQNSIINQFEKEFIRGFLV